MVFGNCVFIFQNLNNSWVRRYEFGQFVEEWMFFVNGVECFCFVQGYLDVFGGNDLKVGIFEFFDDGVGQVLFGGVWFDYGKCVFNCYCFVFFGLEGQVSCLLGL